MGHIIMDMMEGSGICWHERSWNIWLWRRWENGGFMTVDGDIGMIRDLLAWGKEGIHDYGENGGIRDLLAWVKDGKHDCGCKEMIEVSKVYWYSMPEGWDTRLWTQRRIRDLLARGKDRAHENGDNWGIKDLLAWGKDGRHNYGGGGGIRYLLAWGKVGHITMQTKEASKICWHEWWMRHMTMEVIQGSERSIVIMEGWSTWLLKRWRNQRSVVMGEGWDIWL